MVRRFCARFAPVDEGVEAVLHDTPLRPTLDDSIAACYHSGSNRSTMNSLPELDASERQFGLYGDLVTGFHMPRARMYISCGERPIRASCVLLLRDMYYQHVFQVHVVAHSHHASQLDHCAKYVALSLLRRLSTTRSYYALNFRFCQFRSALLAFATAILLPPHATLGCSWTNVVKAQVVLLQIGALGGKLKQDTLRVKR